MIDSNWLEVWSSYCDIFCKLLFCDYFSKSFIYNFLSRTSFSYLIFVYWDFTILWYLICQMLKNLKIVRYLALRLKLCSVKFLVLIQLIQCLHFCIAPFFEWVTVWSKNFKHLATFMLFFLILCQIFIYFLQLFFAITLIYKAFDFEFLKYALSHSENKIFIFVWHFFWLISSYFIQ